MATMTHVSLITTIHRVQLFDPLSNFSIRQLLKDSHLVRPINPMFQITAVDLEYPNSHPLISRLRHNRDSIKLNKILSSLLSFRHKLNLGKHLLTNSH